MLTIDLTLERALRVQVDAYLRDRTFNLLRVQGGTGLTIQLPTLDLSLLRRRLELRNVRIRYDHREGESYTRFEAATPSILLTGLDLSDLIWHRSFRLVGVRIESPVLRDLDEGPADTAATHTVAGLADTIAAVFPAPDTLLYRVVANWLPNNVRGGRINRLLVEHATFALRRRRGTVGSFDSTADLTLGMEGLQLDSTDHKVFEHGTLTFASLLHLSTPSNDTVLVERGLLTVAKEDTAYSVAVLRTGPGGKGHALRVVGVTRSQARNSLTIDSLFYAPRESDAEYFRGARTRETRVRLTATGIAIAGLHQEGLLQRRVTPASIRIGSLDLDALANQRVPPDPPAKRTPWPAKFASLGWTLGADSIILADGRLLYGELRPDQPKAAELLFDNLRASITNATNDSTRAGSRTPVLVHASGRLYGAGELSATIAVPVQPGPLSARVNGKLSPMAVAPLNRFLTAGDGISITSGNIQKADFGFTVARGLVTGNFAATYTDLDLSVVNKVTGKQNLGAKIKTFMAGIMIRKDSPVDKRGGTPPAPIKYQVRPGDTFWGIMWQALRSGIVKEIKH
jgi:hypothetical protein